MVERTEAQRVQDELIDRAIEYGTGAESAWGQAPQRLMLAEESGELVAAVAQSFRERPGALDHVREEAADVVIVVLGVYGCDREFWAVMRSKLARLSKRLADAGVC